MQIQGVTTTWLLSYLLTLCAVFLKDFFTQHDFLRNKRDSQGNHMRFRCSLNHLLITTYRYILHFKQCLSLWKPFASVGDLITVDYLDYICLQTHFFSQWVLKDIYNIVASHLFTHAVLAVVQCEIWTKVAFAHRSRKKKETTGGTRQANYMFRHGLFLQGLYCLETFCDCSVICQ